MVEKLHGRAKKFTSCFSDSPDHMKILRLRFLCTEIFKTLKCDNPSYMKQIFQFTDKTRPVRELQKLNLEVSTFNSVSFGNNSLKTLGPRVWNTLPYHLKSAKNIKAFKKNLKLWDGRKCCCEKCNNNK